MTTDFLNRELIETQNKLQIAKECLIHYMALASYVSHNGDIRFYPTRLISKMSREYCESIQEEIRSEYMQILEGEKLKTPIHNLYNGLSTRCINVLKSGFRFVEDVNKDDFIRLRNGGKKTWLEVEIAIQKLGSFQQNTLETK